MRAYNKRSESRIIQNDLQLLSFKVNNKIIHAVVSDKSNNGLGCFCYSNTSIAVNDSLNLWDLLIYKICWVINISNNVKLFGLVIVNEF